MTVGELFINIGIKGADKVGNTLSSIGKSLGDISAQGLLSKAAVLGVVYGLEQFMSKSAAMGMALKQFGVVTEFSTDELQKWQVAGMKAGVTAEEIANSVYGLQSAMAKIQLGQGPAGGWGLIANNVEGGISEKDAKNSYVMLEKLREFAQNKKVPIPYANEFLSQVGMSRSMIALLRTMSADDLKKIKPSEIFSKKEVNVLADINVQWMRLHRTFEMAQGHFTAKYGADIVSGLSGAIKVVFSMTENVIKLTKAFPALKIAIGVALAGLALWFAPITSAIALIIAGLNEIQKFREKKDLFGGAFKYDKKAKEYKASHSVSEFLFPDKSDKPQKNEERADNRNSFMKFLFPEGDESKGKGFDPSLVVQKISDMLSVLIPNMSNKVGINPTGQAAPIPQTRSGSIGNNEVNINQNINHYGDAKDTKAVKDLHKSAAAAYYGTNPAQLQFN